jgi:hypothetical protein
VSTLLIDLRCGTGRFAVIAASQKLWRAHHLTYDQARCVAKEVRRALGLKRRSKGKEWSHASPETRSAGSFNMSKKPRLDMLAASVRL